MRSIVIAVPRKPAPLRALAGIDREALAEFQAGIRRRYSDEQILAQLAGCAERLERSPTMREFEEDPGTSVHPQTVIQHFGSWNEAKRRAGLVPRRFARPDELVRLLRELGEHRASMPSKSLYWHTFGSLKNALREAGFDVPVGEERLERAVEQGAVLARAVGRLPKFADWAAARRGNPALMSEWQVYRMLEPQRDASAPSGRRRQVGAWATFQFLARERLREEGAEVSAEGRLVRQPRSRQGAGGRPRPRAARARPGAASPRRPGRA